MTSVVLGAGLQKLGGSEFQNCTSLVSVDLSKAVNIEEIPPYTFSGCSALEQIVIPSQIKKIGYGAFSNCTSLKADKVTMSENLQSMAGSVFFRLYVIYRITGFEIDDLHTGIYIFVLYRTCEGGSSGPDTNDWRAGIL